MLRVSTLELFCVLIDEKLRLSGSDPLKRFKAVSGDDDGGNQMYLNDELKFINQFFSLSNRCSDSSGFVTHVHVHNNYGGVPLDTPNSNVTSRTILKFPCIDSHPVYAG